MADFIPDEDLVASQSVALWSVTTKFQWTDFISNPVARDSIRKG
jgi:hypothetical protein